MPENILSISRIPLKNYPFLRQNGYERCVCGGGGAVSSNTNTFQDTNRGRGAVSSNTFQDTNSLPNFHNETTAKLTCLEVVLFAFIEGRAMHWTFIHKWLHFKGHLTERHPMNYAVTPLYTLTQSVLSAPCNMHRVSFNIWQLVDCHERFHPKTAHFQ